MRRFPVERLGAELDKALHVADRALAAGVYGEALNIVADAIEKAIEPSGVAVTIEAEHLCMKMRGVEKQNSVMKTSVMLGTFRTSQATRMEYLNLIHG